MRFLSAGAASASRLSAAQIRGAGQFIAAVINHVVARQSGRDVGPHLLDLHMDHDRGKNQKRFQ